MISTPSTLPVPQPAVLPELPKSWSALTWQQLCDVWACKMRYGGNADVARAAALLALLGLTIDRSASKARRLLLQGRKNGQLTMDVPQYDPVTGEQRYVLCVGENADGMHGAVYTVTARELSQLARQALPWFDYPYGDPGKEAVKDDNGKVIEEAVDPVRGYVNTEWRDAMALPEETVTVSGLCFALPQVACNSLTWQQYRTLQATASGLFDEGASEEEIIGRQAEFVAHMMVPASKEQQSDDRFSPKHRFLYDADRAEQTVEFWRDQLPQVPALFHILFQTYQTAMRYYEQVFPMLFNGGGKQDPLQDALTGEVRTLNAVMHYQGYTKPEDVYAENLPVILSTLNTMAEEAKQIEQMNARIKSKKH